MADHHKDNHIKKKKAWGGVMLCAYKHWRGRDRWAPRACWPASLAYLVTSRPFGGASPHLKLTTKQKKVDRALTVTSKVVL